MADKVDFTTVKRTATKVRRAVDFSGEMETGDTVATVSVTAKDSAGVDVSTSLISAPAASGTKVLWTLNAWGTVGESYYIRAVATTTEGDILPKVLRLIIEGL